MKNTNTTAVALNTCDFDYQLPDQLIAQHPLPQRDSSRLLTIDRATSGIRHGLFSALIDSINPIDLLVINDTKVIPARLFGHKETGGKLECLIERVINQHEALAHIRASKSPQLGSRICFEEKVWARVVQRDAELFHLHFDGEQPLLELLEQYGHMPLPPYITRSDELDDKERYQTIFAQKPGAVAAPTASLHFSQTFMDALKRQGTQIANITLHVGAGTFQPVRTAQLNEHVMHQEWIDVPTKTIAAIQDCKRRGGRVIAVGTTAMRALETCALTGELLPYTGFTDIFIYPGFEFNVVDCLVTNFHLPKSTLLMLVCAFAGLELTREAYAAAISERYRFFSYGDAMFIE